MADCPDGLVPGFGPGDAIPNAVCATRSFFGSDAAGLDIIVSGTGYLIRSGANGSFVLTAAHNLHHPDFDREVLAMDLFFGRHGEVAAERRALAGIAFPPEYAESFAPPQWDFGVARVAMLNANFRPIPLAASTAAGDTGKIIVGYPDDGDCKDSFEPYHANFQVFPSGPSNYGYRDQMTYVGMSGAPLLAMQGGQVVSSFGIHIRGPAPGEPDRHRGVRFSPAVLERISSLMN
jgi:V8-like Glu-specific endopeptidase